MAANMLPILLLGGAALFLMSRGGDEDGGGPIGEPIDKDVEALSNVKLWVDSDDTLSVLMGPFPRILISTTGWSLEEVSTRAKSTIEANPEINFLFAPISILANVMEQFFGASAVGPIPPNSTMMAAGISLDDEGVEFVVDELNWDAFDTDLVAAVEYIKTSPALVRLDRGRNLGLRADSSAAAPAVTANGNDFMDRLRVFFK